MAVCVLLLRVIVWRQRCLQAGTGALTGAHTGMAIQTITGHHHQPSSIAVIVIISDSMDATLTGRLRPLTFAVPLSDESD